MKIPKQFHKFKAAFTLIELLIVIVIVAVLAGLLFPLATSMRKKASSAISVSNLRQIGAAIVTYSTDNNNSLPGPVLTDNYRTYQDNSTSGQLAWLLRGHLTSTPLPQDPKPRMFHSPMFDYPAAKNKGAPTYVVYAKQTDSITGGTFYPMGNYNANSSGEKTPPMTMVAISGKNISGRPWITETDQRIRPSTASTGTPNSPPHGDFRNTLMLDFSVKAIPLGETKPL